MKGFSKHKVFPILVPIFLFICYFAFSVLFAVLFENVIFASFLADVAILACCLSCYLLCVREHGRDKFVIKTIYVVLFLVTFVFLWIATQSAAACIMTHVSDSSWKAYREIQESDMLGYVLLSVFLAPLVEEVLFRGVAFGMFRKRMPVLLAALLSSVMFAIAHGTWVHVPVAIELGLFSCFLYEYTGYLRYSVFMHFFYNACSISFIIPVPDIMVSIPVVLIANGLLIGILVWRLQVASNRKRVDVVLEQVVVDNTVTEEKDGDS